MKSLNLILFRLGLLLIPVLLALTPELPVLHGGCITSGNQVIHYEDIPAPMTATAATGGNCGGVYSYQWQWSRDNIVFYDIPGATGQNITYSHPLSNYGLGVTLPETVYIQRRTICGTEVQYTMSVTVTRGAVYYNQDMSGYYYPTDCELGETPQPVWISVPAGTFMSSNNVGEANNMAVAWAQGQANEIGECVANVSLWYYNNSEGNPLYVVLTNTSTWSQYWFEMYPWQNGYLGDVPAGNYNIEFFDYYGWYYRNYSVGCGNYGAGYPPTYMYNVNINSSCNTFNVYGM